MPIRLLPLALGALVGCAPGPRAVGVQGTFRLPPGGAAIAPAGPGAGAAEGGAEGAAGGAGGSAPAASAVPSATPTPREGRGGGAGGGAGGPTEAPGEVAQLRVLDPYGQPVAGATVRYADGTVAVSDAEGRAGPLRPFPGGQVEVRHPAYAASTVGDLDAADALHLGLAGGLSGAFDVRRRRVEGRVDWPLDRLATTTVFFAADRPAFGLGGSVGPDGAFGVEIVTDAPGDPVGVLVAAGGDDAGRLLYGVSARFAPFSDPAPGPVALVPADGTLPFELEEAPAGLPGVRTRLELLRGDEPPIVLERGTGAGGAYAVPAPDALPGALRVAFEALADDGRRSSIAAFPAAGGRVQGRLLAPPAVAVDAAAYRLDWPAVPGAVGYRIALRAAGAAAPAWEAWQAAAGATIPADDWPAGGEAEVQAVDAPGFGARSIASLGDGPARLRVEPWVAAASYRVAATRVALP